MKKIIFPFWPCSFLPGRMQRPDGYGSRRKAPPREWCWRPADGGRLRQPGRDLVNLVNRMGNSLL